jgi:hypothetical protein
MHAVHGVCGGYGLLVGKTAARSAGGIRFSTTVTNGRHSSLPLTAARCMGLVASERERERERRTIAPFCSVAAPHAACTHPSSTPGRQAGRHPAILYVPARHTEMQMHSLTKP